MMMSHKAWFAVIAVAIALTGVLTRVKWLTVAALVIWVVAMMVFGKGRRWGGERGRRNEE